MALVHHERLSQLLRGFAVKYQDFQYKSGTDSGALAQLWIPTIISGRECLVTQGAPFAFIGCSDQLALFRHHAVRYQALCSAINMHTRCPISRVYANLPPRSADGSNDSSSSTPTSSSSSELFDRCAAVQLANIHSELLLAVYDDSNEGQADEAQQKPAAVFELSLHESHVDFTTAVEILDEVARSLGFWIPQYNSNLPRKSIDIPLLSSSSSGGAAQQPAGICTSSWFQAQQPYIYKMHNNQQQAQQRLKRGSVVYTAHCNYDFARQPASSALKTSAAFPSSSGFHSSNSGVAAAPLMAQQGSMRHVSWHGSHAGAATMEQQQQQQNLPSKQAPAWESNPFEANMKHHVQISGTHQSQVSPSAGSKWPAPFQQQQQQHRGTQQQCPQQQQQQQQQAWFELQQQQHQQGVGVQNSNASLGAWQNHTRQQQQQQHLALHSPQAQQQQRMEMGYHSHGQHALTRTLTAPWQQQQQLLQRSDSRDVSMGLSEPLPPLRLHSLSSASSGDSGRLAAGCMHLGARVRALVVFGGCFMHTAVAGVLQYVGGVQKVVSVSRNAGCLELFNLLNSKAPVAATDLDSFTMPLDTCNSMQVKYALPGATGVYIDISNDDDVMTMWEEWDDFICSSSQATSGMPRLQLFVGSTSNSGSGSMYSDMSVGRYMPETGEPTFERSVSNGRRPVQRSKSCIGVIQRSPLPQPRPTGPSMDSINMSQAAAMFASLAAEHQRSQAAAAGNQQLLAGFSSAVMGAFAAQHQQSKSCPGSPTAGDDAHGREVVSCSSNARSEAPCSLWGQDVEDNHAVHAKAGIGSAGSAGTIGPVHAGASSSSRSSSSSSRNDMKPRHANDLEAIVQQLKSKVEVIRPQDLTIVRYMACGSFGEVYLAKWHGTEVAVKCLSPSLLLSSRAGSSGSWGSGSKGSSTPGAKAATDLMREAAALASMRHPNIVAVYGVVLPPRNMLGPAKGSASCFSTYTDNRSPDRLPRCGDEGSGRDPEQPGSHVSGPAMVCEYMSAGSLQGAIRSKPDWLRSRLVKAKIMLDTARGLSYLHSKQMVHFDLKSANLLFTFKDRVPTVKVADFGLTKSRHQTYVTGVDSMRGTLPWIAPEIFKNPNNVTEAADIYSFGVIMWELWTEQEPFEGAPLHSLLYQLTLQGNLVLPIPGSAEWGKNDEPPPVEPGPGWEGLMRQCLSVDPAARPTSKQLIVKLENMLAVLRQSK